MKRNTHVTDNPQGADRRRDVHTGERRDTGPTGVENVVFARERVLFAAEEEGQLWEVLDGVTVDSVLTVPRLGSADPEVYGISI